MSKVGDFFFGKEPKETVRAEPFEEHQAFPQTVPETEAVFVAPQGTPAEVADVSITGVTCATDRTMMPVSEKPQKARSKPKAKKAKPHVKRKAKR